ncbi:MAG: flippase-like domain-containing protein [Vagococcus sp.]|jgi:uncharacterized membrane protein YbhN (UPF0104 family)|nr:flippase-like domain-containing protein [Vagococcus sp.]
MYLLWNDIKTFLKKYKHFFQVSLSLVILIIIIHKVDLSSTLKALISIDVNIILLLLSITILKLTSQILYWLLCLKLNEGFNSTFYIIVKTHLIGLALRFVLPAGLATFGKVYYIDQIDKKKTFFSILIEKFIFTWAIILFATWAAIYAINSFWFLFLLLFLAIFIVPFILPLFLKRNPNFEYLIQRRYYRVLPRLIAIQIIFRILTIAQYFIILNFLTDLNLYFFDVAIVSSLILVSNIIPFTFNGLGLREVFAIYLLPQIGVSPEIAIVTTLLIFFLNGVLPALPGVFYILTNKKKFTIVND